MSFIFTTIGPIADYGTHGRWLLLTLTVICWGSQYASISLTGGGFVFLLHHLTPFPPLEPSRWGAAMALYMIGFVTYGATLVFYAAAFPRLARNTPHARELRHKQQVGEISTEEYEVEESLEKNRISNISTVCSYPIFSRAHLVYSLKAHSNIGFVVTLCLGLTLLLPLEGHPMVNNYVLVL